MNAPDSLFADAGKLPGLVEYRSRGALLIAGPMAPVIACARQLAGELRCTLLIDGGAEGGVPEADDTEHLWLNGRLTGLHGHLGAFQAEALLDGEAEPCDLAERLGQTDPVFDLVLDLNQPPLFTQAVLPPGYYAPGDDAALAHTLGELPGMIGEFEKPRYFLYDPDICAHGDSGQVGCSRCLDACAARAIHPANNHIEVDPYLCQGCGACATACPTGAISYNYPDRATLINTLRARLTEARDSGMPVSVIFHDRPEYAPPSAPGHAVLAIEDLGAVGMEAWLSALAFGAQRVLLIGAPTLPADSRFELRRQMNYASAIVSALNLPSDCLQFIEAETPADVATALANTPYPIDLKPATFAGLADKREQLRFAIDHLYEATGRPVQKTVLPTGAPFGEITVNRDTCTLCMSCVSVCPASALEAGDEQPVLKFLEANCVQCGLCEAACPEDAIDLNARLLFDHNAARQRRVLHEEQAFCCVSCGKPFGTVKLINTMLDRLQGHWMFQNERARRRLQMCEDCRVRDVLTDEDAMQSAPHAGQPQKPGRVS
jgi:ferredoxin